MKMEDLARGVYVGLCVGCFRHFVSFQETPMQPGYDSVWMWVCVWVQFKALCFISCQYRLVTAVLLCVDVGLCVGCFRYVVSFHETPMVAWLTAVCGCGTVCGLFQVCCFISWDTYGSLVTAVCGCGTVCELFQVCFISWDKPVQPCYDSVWMWDCLGCLKTLCFISRDTNAALLQQCVGLCML